MSRVVAATFPTAFLFICQCGLVLGRSEVLSPATVIVVFALSAMTGWFYSRLPAQDEEVVEAPAADPWLRLRSNRRTLALGSGLVVSATLLFFIDVAFFGHSMVSAPWFNTGREALPASAGFGHTVDPWAGFLIESPGLFMTGAAFAAGEIPFWNPFEACGTPYAANGEMAVFSLLQLPLHLAPSLAGWDAYQIVRVLLAGIGAWFCAFACGRSSRASLIPAFGIAFGGVFILFSNLVHLNTALVIPWVILSVECFLARPSIRRWTIVTALIALGLNGGNPQPLACCLVLYAPVVLLRSWNNWRGLAGYGLAAAAAGGLAAFTLLPLADLLARSENRTYFLLEITGTASHIMDWFAPGGPLLGEAPEGLSGPPWWRVGTIPCTLALLAIKGGSRRETGIKAGVVIYLLFALFPAISSLFHALPIIGGLKWTKYTTSAQFLVLLLAATGFDRIKREQRNSTAIWAVLLALAVVLHGAWFRNRFDSQSLGAIAIIAAMAGLLLLRSRVPWTLLILPLCFFAESSYHRPSYPQRQSEIQAPRGLPPGSDITSRNWVPMAHRTMGYRDAVAPLLSGMQGWYDIRSVGAFPLTRYHKMMAPYMNCGPWPPYMLLGASREIILSPYLDLTGTLDVVFREGDFKDMVRERREDLLESNQFVRFGEFQRALDYASITTSNLVAPDAFEGSFVLLPSAPFSLKLDLMARSARIGFRCESSEGKPFTVDAELGGVRHRITDGEAVVFDIEDATSPVAWNMALESEASLRFVLTEWWVDRHITKGKNDFKPVPNEHSEGDKLVILRNQYPLPLARVMYRGQFVPESGLSDKLRNFVATGEGWDHRREALITLPEDGRQEDFPPLDGKSRETAGRIERKGWNRMRVRCTSRSDAWLTVAVSHDPGWTATVDGRPAPVCLANGAFMAVPLEGEGEHDVEFTYEPLPFRRGLWISALTAVLLILVNSWPLMRGLRASKSVL